MKPELLADASPAAAGPGVTRRLRVSDDCGGSEDVTIRVFAAASLTESFTELGKQFEERPPGHQGRVQLRPELRPRRADRQRCARRRLRLGQPEQHGRRWSRTGTPRTRRTSRRTAWRSPSRRTTPASISALADLAKPGVKVALCQAQVPCGKVAAEVFTNAGITVKPVTEEVDVKSVLTKVTPRRGRRRGRLRDRRPRRGRRGQGRRDPGRPERLDHLPDRHARRTPSTSRRGRRLRRPRALRRRCRRCSRQAGFQSP